MARREFKPARNGNVLITNVGHGRLIEVTSGGEIVWDLHLLSPIVLPFTNYQHQLVPYGEP